MPKILAIDDKEDNLNTFSAVLTNMIPECKVIKARSGYEGLNLAKSNFPDVILLDIKMPKMDGFEICQLLKSNKATRHIPVVLITAVRTDVDSRIKGLETGADAFLSKPIDQTELAAQVNAMLRIKKAEDVLRADKKLLEDEVADRTKELRESEERYRILAETMNEGLWVMDENGVINIVNDKYCEMLGISRADIVGNHWNSIFDKSIHGVMQTHLEKVKKDIPDPYEIKHKHKDGKKVYLHFSPKLMLDPAGKIKGSFAIITDITKQKKSEDELKKHRHHLEKLVAERTRQLVKAVKDLEAKNKDLEKFNDLFVGREFRIKELRDKVAEYEKKFGKI